MIEVLASGDLEEKVWSSMDAQVNHLKWLWNQRIGWQAANDDAPWLIPQKADRARTGDRKGLRARR